ncbi:MAG: TetR/AcrR family transcriptional regulator [Candidatus Eisenbacteria bacterium]|nr:TetR/AcrR family transcriptional regulator [Candidatus Eisenbacteria bacterium]MCC7143169.1 TetR/AcrR family transcriptional regulator [Candidatus Eisenbacteria bacterium]
MPPATTRPRSRDPEKTRERLLGAGEALFAARGLDGASTDEIARLSGVNKAMINYHFGGKEQLYVAILLKNFDRVVGTLREIRMGAYPPDEKLRRFIGAFGRMHIEHPHLSSMVLREVLAGGASIDDVLRPRLIAVFGLLSEILAEGVGSGVFRQVDPAHAHLSILGSLMFFFATAPYRQSLATDPRVPVGRVDPEAYVRWVEEVGLGALLAAPTKRRSSPTRPPSRPAAKGRKATTLRSGR